MNKFSFQVEHRMTEIGERIDVEQQKNLDDDEDVQLSSYALQALQEFLQQKQSEESGETQKEISEDWVLKQILNKSGFLNSIAIFQKLSQFWYDKATTETLAKEVIELGNSYRQKGAEKFSVAFISCPTLFQHLVKNCNLDRSFFNLKLFEYDNRFQVYGSDFIFYDYNQPLAFEGAAEAKQTYDLVIADPPYLSQECFIKTSITIKSLAKSNDAKFIVCSGAVMADLISRCLNNTRLVKFEPRHENNLGNEFRCYANYETFYLDQYQKI